MKSKISLLIILAMILTVFSGCGSQAASSEEKTDTASGSVVSELPPDEEVSISTETAGEASSEPEITESQAAESAASSSAADSSAEEVTETVPDKIVPPENPYTLPLSDENVTYSFFWTYPPFLAEQIDDLTDGPAKQELQQRTGVSIEFTAVSAPVAGEQFNLMVASEDYTDIIQDVTTYYASGMDRAVSDEIVLDLRPLLEEDMQVYYGMITANDEIRKQLTSSDGYIGAIYRLYSEPSVPKVGNVVRQDWLNDLGMDVPVTISDYYEILNAFKTEKGATEPYYFMNTGVGFTNSIIGAYGVQASFYQEDGMVFYGPTQPGMKDYLTEMNKWYREGLISPDYVNNTSGYPDNGAVTAGQIGIFAQENTYMQDIYSFTTDTSIVLSAIPNAVLEEGDINQFIGFGDWIGGVSWSISSDCENPGLLLNFIDYLFTEEGSNLANYGVEGLSWDYDDNNQPVINEMITNNADYNISMAELKYTLLWAPFVEDYDRFNIGYTEAEIAAADIWRENSSKEKMIPSGVSISTAYQSEYDTIFSDIDTLVAENINRFITGDRNLSEFDAFVEEVNALNLGRCIEIWQEMLDAFNAR